MTMRTEAQSYFDGVDLVTGFGERRDGELCVMSLVALLAGEQHSDRPSTACPVITAFVIRINDAIDKSARQDLKDYATRIMGTNDGRHHDRAWLLTRECVNDVFARMMESKGANGDAVAALPRMPPNADTSYDFRALSSELQAAGRHFGLARDLLKDMRYLLRAMREGRYELVESAAAVLIVDCCSPAELVDDERIGSYGTGCQNYRRDRESELNCHVTILTCHQWPRQSDPGSAVSREGGTSSIRR